MNTYTRQCEQCGNEFEAAREHARFCSPRCRVAWNRAHPPVEAEDGRTCASCGNPLDDPGYFPGQGQAYFQGKPKTVRRRYGQPSVLLCGSCAGLANRLREAVYTLPLQEIRQAAQAHGRSMELELVELVIRGLDQQ